MQRDGAGTGLGRALLVAAFSAARAHGATISRLNTDSRTGSLGLYEHVGMVVVETFEHYAVDLVERAARGVAEIWPAPRLAGNLGGRVWSTYESTSDVPGPDRLSRTNTDRTNPVGEHQLVANIKSQIKRNKQNDAAHERNKSVKSALKTSIRRFHEAAEAGETEKAQDAGQGRQPQARQGCLRRCDPQEPGGQQEVGHRLEVVDPLTSWLVG